MSHRRHRVGAQRPPRPAPSRARRAPPAKEAEAQEQGKAFGAGAASRCDGLPLRRRLLAAARRRRPRARPGGPAADGGWVQLWRGCAGHYLERSRTCSPPRPAAGSSAAGMPRKAWAWMKAAWDEAGDDEGGLRSGAARAPRRSPARAAARRGGRRAICGPSPPTRTSTPRSRSRRKNSASSEVLVDHVEDRGVRVAGPARAAVVARCWRQGRLDRQPRRRRPHARRRESTEPAPVSR